MRHYNDISASLKLSTVQNRKNKQLKWFLLTKIPRIGRIDTSSVPVELSLAPMPFTQDKPTFSLGAMNRYERTQMD